MHKLLFDNNISHRVLPRISDIFPHTNHVMLESLDESSDEKVWYFCCSQPEVGNTDERGIKLVSHRHSQPKVGNDGNIDFVLFSLRRCSQGTTPYTVSNILLYVICFDDAGSFIDHCFFSAYTLKILLFLNLTL